MIEAFLGKPGSGKSYSGLLRLLEEARKTKRNIVTNLDINIPAILEYLHAEYGQTFRADARIFKLEHEKAQWFWTDRGDYNLPLVKNDKGKACSTDWTAIKAPVKNEAGEIIQDGDMGCLYIIDEAQVYFSSRNWAEIGLALREYLTQHRHLGDDLIWISPHAGLVDKDFSRTTQNFFLFRNLSKEKFTKWFRGPAKFLFRSFGSAPTTGKEAHQETGTFSVDVSKIGKLYNTAGLNSGSAGSFGQADTQQKLKGFSIIWVVPLLIIGLIVAAYVFIRGGSVASKAYVQHSIGDSTQLIMSNSAAAGSALSLAGQGQQQVRGALASSPGSVSSPGTTTPQPQADAGKVIRATGYVGGAIWGEKVGRIYLEDGSWIHGDIVQDQGNSWLVLIGKKVVAIPIVPPPTGYQQQPTTPVYGQDMSQQVLNGIGNVGRNMQQMPQQAPQQVVQLPPEPQAPEQPQQQQTQPQGNQPLSTIHSFINGNGRKQ